MNVVIYGAGGHGKVVADVVLASGDNIIGFIADSVSVGTPVLDRTVLGGFEWIVEHRDEIDGVVMGIGDNDVRARIMERLQFEGVTILSAVHPDSTVASSAVICPGTVIMARAVVNPDAVVEEGAIINSGAIIEHDCRVGAFAHISPNAALAGTVRVGARTHIGVGAVVINNTAVGARSIVGAGAVVVDEIGDDVVAYGVPARVQRTREQNTKD